LILDIVALRTLGLINDSVLIQLMKDLIDVLEIQSGVWLSRPQQSTTFQ
jgi:hypothetical protein